MNNFIFKKLNTSLSLILLVAGITHLITPNIFLVAMPPYIPFHFEIIIFTGILELLFSFGLVFKPIIKITSKVLAIYFILILPSHLHVSINNISFFGITSPYLLWGRTLFQGVFILWALRCQKIGKSSL